jgi:type III pantothenate kinase
MNLLIDIGNSRIKWATLVDGEWAATGDSVHKGQDPDTSFEFLSGIDTKPGAVRVANVTGEAMARTAVAAVRARWQMPVEFAESQAAAGPVRNGYHDHRQMGVDRWLAILAAFDRCRGPVCVVDAGTAVTIDQVDGDGKHLGGVILPGPGLMRQALFRDTGDIENLAGIEGGPVRADELTLGRTTGAAIDGGALAAISGLIERCGEQLRQRSGDSALVLTGGDSERIITHLQSGADHRPLLVLEGLAIYRPG